MNVLLAFLRRDALIQGSYRMSVVVSAGSILMTAASFYFIARLIDPAGAAALAPYAGYFPFVLLGLVSSRFLASSLGGFAGSLRDEQLQGTLEAMLASPVGVWRVLVGGVLWEFVWTTLEALLYLGLGVALFGVDLGRMNAPAALVLLGLSIACLSSFGVLSAAAVLVFRTVDPVNWVLGGLMKLAGGVYVPVAILPGWMQAVAAGLPLTYGLDGLRRAVLTGTTLRDLKPQCDALLVFMLILWPLAVVCFSGAIRRLQRDGSLSFR